MITSAWIADAAGAEETSKEKEAKMTVARCSCNAYRWCGTGEAKKCRNDCERLFAICIMRDRQVLCDAIVNCAGRNLNIYDLQWHWKKESHYQCVKPDIRQLPSNYWTRFLPHSSFIYPNLCYSRKKIRNFSQKQAKQKLTEWLMSQTVICFEKWKKPRTKCKLQSHKVADGPFGEGGAGSLNGQHLQLLLASIYSLCTLINLLKIRHFWPTQ